MYPPVSKMHAGSVCVSVIHRSWTWTTGSLTCARDYSCACVYTRGFGHTDSERASTTFVTRKKSQMFLVLLTGFEPQSNDSDALPIGHLTPSHVYNIIQLYTIQLYTIQYKWFCLVVVTLIDCFPSSIIYLYIFSSSFNIPRPHFVRSLLVASGFVCCCSLSSSMYITATSRILLIQCTSSVPMSGLLFELWASPKSILDSFGA